VLFGAQQFRSQVHRRVVGNSGTALFGRMDPDELATAGYQTMAPATRARLATLEKGQLMVRHPHFGQPVFVRFPRPAVLSGREGVERFPPAEELPLDAALTKVLRRLDPTITLGWVKEAIGQAGDDEDGILRARNRTLQARPDDVKAFFRAQLRKRATREAMAPRGPTPLRVPHGDDPYG
jgi:DNA helicase HerA-like ATPase